MIWRVLLTAAYGIALGALLALDNFESGTSDVPLLVLWVAAPVVGFLVGRWWVVLAVLGAMVGHVIGWDSSENDGNPALWPPYLVTMLVYLGVPLLLGAAGSRAWRSRRQRDGAEGPDLQRG